MCLQSNFIITDAFENGNESEHTFYTNKSNKNIFYFNDLISKLICVSFTI
jgi:hypothetical protein